jgi:tetratricopeptide (TPR) repeat protein
MSRRRRVLLALACAAALGAALTVVLFRVQGRSRLPSLVSYQNLPAPFNTALKTRWKAAASPGHSIADVRELALLYQANRLFAEARACYQTIASGPEGLSARDHYYLAAMFQEESSLDRAEAELQATLRAEPGYVPARLALADAHFKGGQTDEAAKDYAAILELVPHHPQASFGMARVELQRGEEDSAVARLKDLIAHHPDSTSGAALLAQILDRRGDNEGSAAMRELSRQTHEPAPSDPWMDAMLTDCYDLQRLGLAFEQYRLDGQMSEAVSLLGRLEELDPNGWIPPMLHGWSQKEAGHYPEAVDEYRTALTRGGDPERICPLLGAALLKEGKASEAVSLLAEYHARLPHSTPILLSYAEAAVWLKDDKLARRLLTEVLQADPYLYMPNMSLVQILWTSGEHDEAAQCLQRVVRVYPNDVDSRGLLAQYYMDKADPWSAIKPLAEAVGIVQAESPRRDRLVKMLDTAYLTAGSLDASQGRFPKALEYSEQSIHLVPGGLRGYALKANICRRLRDYKGAADALRKLSSLDPNEPTIQLNLGDVTYQDGDPAGAREHWQRALELAPADAAQLRSALGLRLSGRYTADMFQ